MDKKIRNKKIAIGLSSLGLLSASICAITLPIINRDSYVVNNNVNSLPVSIKNDKSLNLSTKANLKTNSYTPVISSQHNIASTTYDGYIGYGVGDEILDRTGSPVSVTGGQTTDDRRAIYFTTFDGILRWKFDLNELNNYLNEFDADTDQLRVVDIKPMHNYNNVNNGYLVLTAATGYTKGSQGFGTNVLFMLDEFGNLIEGSINEFELPTFGVTNGRNLIGNTTSNINIISPYSIKLSYSSKTKALVQISANPFAIKTNNMAYKWKLADYLSQEADNESFVADATSIDKTTPIVLLEYDYAAKSFVYQDKVSTTTGRKILKNYTMSSTFTKFLDADNPIVPNQTYILSEMIFYMKSNILGFYGSFLKPGNDIDTRKFDISMYTLDLGKFTLDTKVIEQVIVDGTGEFNELFDYKNYSNDYSGYTFSYIPLNYNASFNSPTATLILPFSGGVEEGFYIIQIFDQLKSNYRKISGWIIDDEKRVPRSSFIDPIYGNIFIPTNNGANVEYIDITYESATNGVSFPNQFEHRTLNITNYSSLRQLLNSTGSVFPISTTNNVYDSSNSYYSKFAFASFSNDGTYKVLYFDTNSAGNVTLSQYPNANEKYQLTTYTELQKRSQDIGWTPRMKKLSEISDERLATIGDYSTVAANAPQDQMPLFYLTLADGQKQLYPLNNLVVSDVVRDYDLATIQFNANFSYRLYGTNIDKTYTQSYQITDFKKDATFLQNTTFNIPATDAVGSPLIIASPTTYQGTYNKSFNYLAGQQVAITNKSETYVYQLKKDKPSSVALFNGSGSINSSVLNEYFEIVKDVNNQNQTPYQPTPITTYKGVFSSYVTYQKGDVVKDKVTNKLFIFKNASNSLSDAIIYNGTDLSTLLPTDITNFQVAMIIKEKMLFGTIPSDFDLDSILIENAIRNNLGSSSINGGNATLTANVKLKKYVDDNGQTQNSSANFPTTPIIINFNNKSMPTIITEEYNVTQFDGLLDGMYAYQLDATFIQNNPKLLEAIVDINRQQGNISNDISASNIDVVSTQAYNKEGQVQMQIALSRWYDENGSLHTSELKYQYITIKGLKVATATKFTNNGVVSLRADQLNVPGLGGLTPQNVTVAQFTSNINNVKEFILNYTFIENNTKLLVDNARPANFNADSINVLRTIPDQKAGSVGFIVSFNSYFLAQSINGVERIVYRQGTSETTFTLSISGFKPYFDNSIDNFNYDAVININSSLKNLSNWPASLRYTITNPIPIPIVFYQTNLNNIESILKQAIVSTFTTSLIDGNENSLYIDGFTLEDVGTISSYYYNNFTGKVVFKANLKKIVAIDELGAKKIIDNSTIVDWNTNPQCQYNISLDGFATVEISKIDGKEIPNITTTTKGSSTIISLDSSIQVNKNSLDISLSDVKDLIKWSGDFATLNGNKFNVASMDDIIASATTNPFANSVHLEKDLVTGIVKVVYEFNKPVYYFPNKNEISEDNNPYALGNLGSPVELSVGSKIIINLTTVAKFDIWEIVFYVAVAVVGIILLSLIIFLIFRGVNRRRLY